MFSWFVHSPRNFTDYSKPLGVQVRHGRFVLRRTCSVQVRSPYGGTDSLRRAVRSLFGFAPPVLCAVPLDPPSPSVAERPLTSIQSWRLPALSRQILAAQLSPVDLQPSCVP